MIATVAALVRPPTEASQSESIAKMNILMAISTSIDQIIQ